jgi:hypothetical protein
MVAFYSGRWSSHPVSTHLRHQLLQCPGGITLDRVRAQTIDRDDDDVVGQPTRRTGSDPLRGHFPRNRALQRHWVRPRGQETGAE